jgi:hypothetical protein
MRKLIVLPTLLFAFFVAAPLTVSAAAAQVLSDPFARAIEAHGGAALQVVQTLILHGKSHQGSVVQTIKISASLAGKLRVDYLDFGQKITRTEVSALDSNYRRVGDRTVWLAPHAGAYAQLDLLSVLGILHLANGIEKTVMGDGVVEGRSTGHVKVVTGREQMQYRRRVKDEAEVHFDTATGWVAAISHIQYAEESLDLPFTLTTTFSDYRPEAGFLLPFKISRYVNGILRETFTVDARASAGRRAFLRRADPLQHRAGRPIGNPGLRGFLQFRYR